MGCAIFLGLITAAGTFDGHDWYTLYLAERKAHYGWGKVFVKGIFANWLVGIATWMANAAQVCSRVPMQLRPYCRGAPFLTALVKLMSVAARKMCVWVQKAHVFDIFLKSENCHHVYVPKTRPKLFPECKKLSKLLSFLQDLTGKAVGIWLPIFAFAAIGFEHSIANMFLIPTGLSRGADITAADFVWMNLIPATLGNFIGGGICMATMYAFVFGRPPIRIAAWMRRKRPEM